MNLKFADRSSSLTTCVLLLVVSLLWLGCTAGVRALALPDEGRYVGVAWEMLQAGDLAVPLLGGMPYFHKPPLFYWLTAFSLHFFGAHEWAARFAPLLASTLTLLGLFLFLMRYSTPLTAWLTVLVLGTQPYFFAGAQFANLDMLVAGMISLAILAAGDALLRAERGEAYRSRLLLAYGLAGLAVLAKGLIGMVLPAGTLVFWLLLRGRPRAVLTLLWLPGLAVFLLVGLPWFVLMQQQFPGFYDYFVIYHHFQRFAQSGFNNAQPFWFYLPVILILVAPWSLWLGGLLRPAFWRGQVGAGIGGEVRLLMLAWLAVVFVFFSLPSSKLIGYVLPALPPLAYLIAEVIRRSLQGGGRARAWLAATLCAAMVLCLAMVYVFAQRDDGSTKALVRQLAPSIQPADQLILLDRNHFDIAFYLQLQKPKWVVSNWADPEIATRDSWKKELADAARFAPEAGQRVLLNAEQLLPALCAQPTEQNAWLLGGAGFAELVPVLAKLPSQPVEKLLLWRWSAAEKAALCR